MKLNRAASAFLATLAARRAASFSTSIAIRTCNGICPSRGDTRTRAGLCSSSLSRNSRNLSIRSSNGGFDGEPPQIAQIGMEQMEEILEDLNEAGREETGYFVVDVRGHDEVAYTGKVSEKVLTLPVQEIQAKNAFRMSEEAFEEEFGFKKPEMDETLVFTCAAGIRSSAAAQMAAMAGYSNLVNYSGGANEWFSVPR